MLFKPRARDVADDFWSRGEVDEAVVRREPVRQGSAVGEERVIPSGGLEPQPVAMCRSAGDQVQPMAGVGEHTVDVQYRQRRRCCWWAHAAAVATRSKTWSVVSIWLRPIYRLIVSSPAS